MDPLHQETAPDHQDRDWSNLNPDLLRLISRKLPELFDFVRFCSVCKLWHSAAPASDHHPLFPCFICRRGHYVLLYSLLSEETHKIKYEDPYDYNAPTYQLYGRMKHHILSANFGSGNLTLLNPFTNSKIILPAVSFGRSTLIAVGLNPNGRWENVAIKGGETDFSTQYLSLLRCGTVNWVTIEKNLSGIRPITYYKGMYYCIIHKTGNTEVVDATTGLIMSTIPPPETRHGYCSTVKRFFVESSGELLLVCKIRGSITNSGPFMEHYFEIYQLKQENEDPQWLKMSKIGDQMLFLDCSGGFSVRATDFNGFKDNCIYYIYEDFDRTGDFFSIPTTYLLRYDINDGCCEQLPCPNDLLTWIMPSLR